MIVLERMTFEHLPEVMRIDRVSFPTPWSEHSYRSEICNAAAYYLVARRQGHIVGYAGAWLVIDEAHITTLGVDPAFRRQGIGELMLLAILTEARARGVRRASLEVRESNEGAIRLYEKYGFRPIARRRGYYSDTGEDAIVMWIPDMAGPVFEQRLTERSTALASEAGERVRAGH
jgi:ribosomal-protein-alanine N-acetyltransferase